MSYRRIMGDVTQTGGSESIFSFEWRLPDFSSLSDKGGDRHESPTFDSCDGKWFLRMYPNGSERKEWSSGSAFVDLFLVRVDRGPPKIINVTAGIRGTEGVENKKGRRQELSWDDNVCCWLEFYYRSKLIEQRSKLMPGDVLIITLEMECDTPSIPRDSSAENVEESKEAEVSTEEKQSTEKQGGEKALEDIGKLLASGEHSDVTVLVGDVTFKVHRNILSVRSPPLSISLQHESQEKASNRIVIEDCDPEVFRDFLQYLYTGSVRSLTEQNVFGLYRVADRYLADDLKSHCLSHIRDKLCVQTFCDTIKLALTHEESDLLQQAIDFAAGNIQSIIISVEWQNFICEYPREANEILIKSIGPRS